jgi:hypothetical protein
MRDGLRRRLIVVCTVAGSMIWGAVAAQTPGHGRWEHEPVAATENFEAGGAKIRVEFGEGDTDLTREEILPWVERAAHAVTVYYGRFPVKQAGVLIAPKPGDGMGGTTWGRVRDVQGFTRIRFGQHTTQRQLSTDWVMTHEMVHMAFPDLEDDQHWLEEGLATYVEPVARAQAGQLPVEKVWGDMMSGMLKGEPGSGDKGLDRTHTWGRTYWGGAMFCLMADVAIRKETKNQKGLQDALRAIVNAGGTIDTDWSLARTLEVGDKATGTKVLTEMYGQWSVNAVPVDLDGLWRQLGVAQGADGVVFDEKAPLAGVREAITRRPSF